MPNPPTTTLTWLPGGAQGAFPVWPESGVRILALLRSSDEWFPDLANMTGRGRWEKGWWKEVVWYAVLDVMLPVPGEGT